LLTQLWSASAGTYTLSFKAAQHDSGNDSYQQLRVNLRPSGTVISAKTLLWCGNQICEERDSTGANVKKRFFAEGEQRIGGSDAGVYYYSYDHLGSIREVTNSSGSLQAQYDYDAWGNAAIEGFGIGLVVLNAILLALVWHRLRAGPGAPGMWGWLLVAVGLVPIMVGFMTFAHGLESSATVSACGSCHVMTPFVRDLQDLARDVREVVLLAADDLEELLHGQDAFVRADHLREPGLRSPAEIRVAHGRERRLGDVGAAAVVAEVGTEAEGAERLAFTVPAGDDASRSRDHDDALRLAGAGSERDLGVVHDLHAAGEAERSQDRLDPELIGLPVDACEAEDRGGEVGRLDVSLREGRGDGALQRVGGARKTDLLPVGGAPDGHAEDAAGLVRNHGVRLRAAAVDAEDLRHRTARRRKWSAACIRASSPDIPSEGNLLPTLRLPPDVSEGRAG
jgi:hypothetical protein